MAAETSVVGAQEVGNAFVKRYYQILHQHPEIMFKFYKDSSVLSRPGPDGVVSTVSSIEDINAMILSLNFEEYKTEIITADAHYSHKDDVVVVVTGCLFEKESKDNVGRKFSQSFLLAPQENGHFVLTDLFRYLDKGQVLKAEPELDNSTSESSATAPEHEPSHIPKVAVPDTTAPIVEKPTNVNNEDKEEEILEEPPQVQQVQTEVRQSAESARPVVPEGKNSDVKVAKPNAGPTPVNVLPINPVLVRPANVGQNPPAPAHTTPTPEHVASAHNSSNASANSRDSEEVDGNSIHSENPPPSVKDEEVEDQFKSSGPMQQAQGGVKAKSTEGCSFNFDEFEQLSSMQRSKKGRKYSRTQATHQLKRNTYKKKDWIELLDCVHKTNAMVFFASFLGASIFGQWLYSREGCNAGESVVGRSIIEGILSMSLLLTSSLIVIATNVFSRRFRSKATRTLRNARFRLGFCLACFSTTLGLLFLVLCLADICRYC